MLYSAPLVTLMTAGLVIPVTVMGLEISTLEFAALFAAVKLPCNTGSAPVVTTKLEGVPPMVSTPVSVAL
jgi:hypothetical protein